MNMSLGVDLAVIPFLVAYDAAEVDLVRRSRPIVPVPSTGARELYDLDVIAERNNLAQALILRLLTPRGSLVKLGHAQYGSRLHELIGRRKNDALRNLCRVYVLEVVAQEPRVNDKAVALTFDPQAETSASFVFTLAVQPVDGSAPVGLSLGVAL
jgi:phage baseplate assembly protein W